METDTKSHEAAMRYFDEGEALLDAGKDAEALAKFRMAWDALPEPRAEDLAVQILAAIADACFHLARWEECRRSIQLAFHEGADVGNPFLRLRLGQALFELGEQEEATNWLVPAYLSEGRRLFEEDFKYLHFFHHKLLPPPDGWPEGW